MPRGVKGSQGLSVAHVTRRLQTPEGKALLGEVLDRLAPAIAEVDRFEPSTGATKPGAPLDRAIFEELCGTFSPASEATREISGAVTRALRRCTDSADNLSAEAVQTKLGPAGLDLLTALSRIEDPTQLQPMHDRRRLDRVGYERIRHEAASDVDVKPMAALNAMAAQIAEPNELEGLGFFGLQHLFVSSVGLFDSLADVGIPHDRMRLLGKIYSTNFGAAARLESRGAQVHDVSSRLRSGKSFEVSMNTAIRENLRAMINELPRPPETNPEPRFLLIDDGADAIKILHDEFPEYAPYFVGVEQTRRGARILRELDLKCPVANVAESWAKLEWESPMIGHSVVLEVGAKLDRLEAYGVSTGDEAVVLGYGAVGQAVAKSLTERGFQVHVFDPSPERRALAEREGMVAHTEKQDALPHAQTLVSCVGRQTLFTEDHDLLPDGAILVNAASADDELGPEELMPLASKAAHRDNDGDLWDHFQGQPIHLGLGEATAHSDWVLRQRSGKEILLVNKGYVVNMTGDRDPIPPRYIQLTRTLLFLGAIAAKRADQPGIIDVPEDWQRSLVDLVQSELTTTGEDLLDPNWEVHDGRPPVEQKPLPASIEATKRRPGQVGGVATSPRTGATDRTVHGFSMGPAAEMSPEFEALHALGITDGEMTPFRAAVYQASRDVGRHFNVFLKVRLDGEGGETVGGGFSVDDSDPHQEFERVYSRYTLDFVQAQMSRNSRGAPRPDKIARHFVQILEENSMDPDAAIAQLQASDDQEIRVLAQLAYRRRARS